MSESTKYLEGGLDVEGTPLDKQVPKWVTARSRAEWGDLSVALNWVDVIMDDSHVHAGTFNTPSAAVLDDLLILTGSFAIDAGYDFNGLVGAHIPIAPIGNATPTSLIWMDAGSGAASAAAMFIVPNIGLARYQLYPSILGSAGPTPANANVIINGTCRLHT